MISCSMAQTMVLMMMSHDHGGAEVTHNHMARLGFPHFFFLFAIGLLALFLYR